jgi:pyridoxal phosphate enzyme (YggS family)
MSVSDNLARIRESISEIALRAGRPADSVQLLAVSKFHPAEAVMEAARAGQRLFGENRVQEAVEKFPAILQSIPDISVHLIGQLQRNKVKTAVSLAGCIQSVDRAELLIEIEKQAALAGKTIDILFEMHTGEDSKSGYPDDDALFRSIDLLDSMSHVRCRGLMTMAPFTTDEQLVRHSFRSLAATRQACIRRYSALDFSELSMGMSADYEIAIAEGSTMVRIGTAIFGERT